MNWKRLVIGAAIVLLIVRFSPQIRAAIVGVPLLGKVVG